MPKMRKDTRARAVAVIAKAAENDGFIRSACTFPELHTTIATMEKWQIITPVVYDWCYSDGE